MGPDAVHAIAERLTALDVDPVVRWSAVEAEFRAWVTRSDLHSGVDELLASLPCSDGATHLVWCLRDVPGEAYTFWLHEYKSRRDWRADHVVSVHNHRYHSCTTLLRGSYLDERYDITIDPATGLVGAARLQRSSTCGAGEASALLFTEFHRIPYAADRTRTFLVKSRPIAPWSLSFDVATGHGDRHVPPASRLLGLVKDS